MSRRGARSGFYGPAVWMLSLLLPAGNLFPLLFPHPVAEAPEDGVASLSLPRGLAGTASAGLPDWRALARRVRPDPPAVPPGPVAPPEPDPPACRIRLHGHLAGEDGIEYYFLDTIENRWFRLRCGETDAASGIRLLAGEPAPGLRLVDQREDRAWSVRLDGGAPAWLPEGSAKGAGLP